MPRSFEIFDEDTLSIPAVVVAAVFAVLLARARRLNAIVLGDDACAALGVHAGRLRWQLLILATVGRSGVRQPKRGHELPQT